jgi:hypothetical protein
MLFDAGLSSLLTAGGTDKRVFIPLQIMVAGLKHHGQRSMKSVCSSFESKAKPIDRRGSIDRDGQPHGTRKVTVAPYPSS